MSRCIKLKVIKPGFAAMSGIETISIPEGVTEIIGNAFEHCLNLKTIRLPSTLRVGVNDFYEGAIGSYAFNYCVNVTDIYCAAVQAPSARSMNDAGTGSVYKGAFGDSSANYVGRNTYSAKTNKLHVPVGATGYSTTSGITSDWKNTLCSTSKCGFTLVYDL